MTIGLSVPDDDLSVPRQLPTTGSAGGAGRAGEAGGAGRAGVGVCPAARTMSDPVATRTTIIHAQQRRGMCGLLENREPGTENPHCCEVGFTVFRCASKNSTIAAMFGATTSLCSPPGTSMYLNSTPSSFSFATIVRDPETATVGSASP